MSPQPNSDPPQRGRDPEIEALFARAAPELPAALRSGARDLARRAASEAPKVAPPERRRTGLQPGSVVANRYRIMEELGRGGIATVYKAEDTKFGVEIALKVAAASGEAIADFRARFRREARISYQIGKAPGIVRALDWGEIDPEQSLYLALDLVPAAKTLDLRSGPLHERLERLATAASLVEIVHAQGVVHRDIKPGNFLVTQSGVVHLGDFGTARSLDSPDDEQARPAHLTATGVLIGTPLYMAPEQFNDPRGVGPAADVYALGVMLYHCLTGRFPYDGETAAGFLETQLKTRYGLAPLPPSPRTLEPSVDPALDRLCMEAIELDPDDRLGSVHDFLARLRGRVAARTHERTRDPGLDPGADLGLDDDGFVPLTSLRSLLVRLGKERFLQLLGETPALLAEHERPVEGKRFYEGRVAFLLSRSSRRPARSVSLGRTTESDLTVSLVSVSKHHVQFEQTGAGWTITEAGSSNGTTLNGEALRAGVPQPLSHGDAVCLAQHLTLRFLPSEGLQRRLRA